MQSKSTNSAINRYEFVKKLVGKDLLDLVRYEPLGHTLFITLCFRENLFGDTEQITMSIEAHDDYVKTYISDRGYPNKKFSLQDPDSIQNLKDYIYDIFWEYNIIEEPREKPKPGKYTRKINTRELRDTI